MEEGAKGSCLLFPPCSSLSIRLAFPASSPAYLVAHPVGGTANKDLYVYDASGNRVLRRTTTSSGTTMTAHAFGLEEHSYFNAGATISHPTQPSQACRLCEFHPGQNASVFSNIEPFG
jgi:hypothetical protein